MTGPTGGGQFNAYDALFVLNYTESVFAPPFPLPLTPPDPNDPRVLQDFSGQVAFVDVNTGGTTHLDLTLAVSGDTGGSGGGTNVPEPGTLTLLSSSGLLLFCWSRRYKPKWA